MKCKVYRNYITIPAEIRQQLNIKDGDFLDVSVDGNSFIVKHYVEDYDPNAKITMELEKKPKSKSKPKQEKKSTGKKIRKIEANFMDAPKLYKNYFSECGLVVRTKNRYVNDFCKDCQGQLALEWEDRADVKCKYLASKTEEKCKDLEKEINDKKGSRHEEIQNLSKSIKKATEVLDEQIKELDPPKTKRGRRPKVTSKYGSDTTIIKPVYSSTDEFLKCANCNQFVSSGFMLDDTFLCKECTKEDFKKYMKGRGN